MTLFLVLLLQFKVMLSSDKYKKKSLYTIFYNNPRFLRLARGFGQKDKKNAKNLIRETWKQKKFYSNSKKIKGFSFDSYSFPMVIHSIDLYNNANQPFSF